MALAWLSSWWNTPGPIGPARNLPTNGQNIKEFFAQKPLVIIVPEEEILNTRARLRPVIVNEIPPISNKPDILKEFDTVFALGLSQYFALKQKQRPPVESKLLEFVEEELQEFEEI